LDFRSAAAAAVRSSRERRTVSAQSGPVGSGDLGQVRPERGGQTRQVGEDAGWGGRQGETGVALARPTHRRQPRRQGHGHAQTRAGRCPRLAVHRRKQLQKVGQESRFSFTPIY